ncbi:putative reverse transcriptase domain-containing protein [Tanacetum coccineum]
MSISLISVLSDVSYLFLVYEARLLIRSRLELFDFVILFVDLPSHHLLKVLSLDLFLKCNVESHAYSNFQEHFSFTKYRCPVWGCDRLVSRAKVIENQVMSTPVISISLDSSNESVGSSISRVILIGSIPIEVPVASEVGAAAVASPARVLELDTHSSSESDPSKSSLPPVPVAPMVSPFLCSDDSESNIEMPERHVSSTPHDAMVARWRSRVASRPSLPSRSSSPTTSTSEIPTGPIPPAPPTIDILIGRLYRTHLGGPCRALIARKSVRPLPSHCLALRYTSYHLDRFTSRLSSDHSSSDHSLADHTSESSPSDSPTTTSDRHSHLPSHYAGPSRKRCRSPTTNVPSSILASGALFPTRADLLLPRKRFRDSYSSEDSVEEDIDVDVLTDIEADDAAVEVASDMDVEARLDASISIEVGIDILDDMLMPDVVERLEQVEEVVQEAKSLIASEERVGLLDHVVALERSNVRLRDTLRIESIVTITRSDDGDNGNDGGNGNGNGGGNGDGNGGGNGNGNRGGNGNGNPNRNDRGVMPIARECTYHDFVKCQPLNFKGTKGVVGFTRWFEKIETVFHISNYPERTIRADAAFAMSWRELMKLMTEVYCPINEIQKIESELLNLTVKNNDLAAYTQRFQELTMMCTKMVPEKEDRVEKFIRGLLDNIQGNLIDAKPTRLQDVIRIANNLMDQKLKGYAVRNAENKRRLDNNQRDNHGQQPPVKRQNVRETIRKLDTWQGIVKPQLLQLLEEPIAKSEALLDLFCTFSPLKIDFYGLGLDRAYWGFLGVGTTLDILQNIIFIPYFQYGVLRSSGYDGMLRFKGVTKQIVGVVPKGLALRVVLVDLHSKDESGKGFKLEIQTKDKDKRDHEFGCSGSCYAAEVLASLVLCLVHLWDAAGELPQKVPSNAWYVSPLASINYAIHNIIHVENLP